MKFLIFLLLFPFLFNVFIVLLRFIFLLFFRNKTFFRYKKCTPPQYNKPSASKDVVDVEFENLD